MCFITTKKTKNNTIFYCGQFKCPLTVTQVEGNGGDKNNITVNKQTLVFFFFLTLVFLISRLKSST